MGTTHLKISLLRKVKILKIAQGNKRYPRAISSIIYGFMVKGLV
jgi:hypothetical protein